MTEWTLTCVPEDPRYGRKPQTLIAEVDDATGLVGVSIRVSDYPWTLIVQSAERIEPDSTKQSEPLTQ